MSGNEQPRLQSIREETGAVVLSLDTGETFEVAPESVPASLPPVGEELSLELLAEIRKAAERKQIARRLFGMLDRRLRSVARTRAKLIEEGFDGDSVVAVLDRMAESGLYSDRIFAEAWCRDCLLTRSVGRYYLVTKLRGQGVAVADAQAAADNVLGGEREEELALAAAEARWRKSDARRFAAADRDQRRRIEAKVIRFLQGRGFTAEQAVRAMRRARPGTEEE